MSNHPLPTLGSSSCMVFMSGVLLFCIDFMDLQDGCIFCWTVVLYCIIHINEPVFCPNCSSKCSFHIHFISSVSLMVIISLPFLCNIDEGLYLLNFFKCFMHCLFFLLWSPTPFEEVYCLCAFSFSPTNFVCLSSLHIVFFFPFSCSSFIFLVNFISDLHCFLTLGVKPLLFSWFLLCYKCLFKCPKYGFLKPLNLYWRYV